MTQQGWVGMGSEQSPKIWQFRGQALLFPQKPLFPTQTISFVICLVLLAGNAQAIVMQGPRLAGSVDVGASPSFW